MKNWTSILVIGIVAFVSASCKENVDEPYVITCSDGPVGWEKVPYFNFKLQNVGFDPDLQSNAGKEVFMIINTENELYKYLKADYYPKIDFKRKSILLARVDNTFGYYTTQTITMDCKTKKLLWSRDAVVPTSGHDVLLSYVFTIMIPKVDEKTIFTFDRNF